MAERVYDLVGFDGRVIDCDDCGHPLEAVITGEVVKEKVRKRAIQSERMTITLARVRCKCGWKDRDDDA